MTPDEILAEEAAGRQRAGVAALAAALLTILGVVLTTLGQPSASKFDDKIDTGADKLKDGLDSIDGKDDDIP